MTRKTFLMASTLALFTLTGCAITDTANGGDPLTEETLTGSILLFTNPNPNTGIGEHGEWEYTFRSGDAIGCNSNASYTASGWTIMGDNAIRVYFGSQYEEYTLGSTDGSLADGTYQGTFHLTSSVPGNVVDGTFRQISFNVYC